MWIYFWCSIYIPSVLTQLTALGLGASSMAGGLAGLGIPTTFVGSLGGLASTPLLSLGSYGIPGIYSGGLEVLGPVLGPITSNLLAALYHGKKPNVGNPPSIHQEQNLYRYVTPEGHMVTAGGVFLHPEYYDREGLTTALLGEGVLPNGGTSLPNVGASLDGALLGGRTSLTNGGASFYGGGTSLLGGRTSFTNGGASLYGGGAAAPYYPNSLPAQRHPGQNLQYVTPEGHIIDGRGASSSAAAGGGGAIAEAQTGGVMLEGAGQNSPLLPGLNYVPLPLQGVQLPQPALNLLNLSPTIPGFANIGGSSAAAAAGAGGASSISQGGGITSETSAGPAPPTLTSYSNFISYLLQMLQSVLTAAPPAQESSLFNLQFVTPEGQVIPASNNRETLPTLPGGGVASPQIGAAPPQSVAGDGETPLNSIAQLLPAIYYYRGPQGQALGGYSGTLLAAEIHRLQQQQALSGFDPNKMAGLTAQLISKLSNLRPFSNTASLFNNLYGGGGTIAGNVNLIPPNPSAQKFDSTSNSPNQHDPPCKSGNVVIVPGSLDAGSWHSSPLYNAFFGKAPFSGNILAGNGINGYNTLGSGLPGQAAPQIENGYKIPGSNLGGPQIYPSAGNGYGYQPFENIPKVTNPQILNGNNGPYNGAHGLYPLNGYPQTNTQSGSKNVPHPTSGQNGNFDHSSRFSPFNPFTYPVNNFYQSRPYYQYPGFGINNLNGAITHGMGNSNSGVIGGQVAVNGLGNPYGSYTLHGGRYIIPGRGYIKNDGGEIVYGPGSANTGIIGAGLGW